MSAGTIPGLVLGGEPRAQLLPASVKQRERVKSTRRMMGLLVVLSVVVVGAGTFGAFTFAQQAEGQLAAAQAQTLELLAQQGQYAEGAKVAALVTATTSAQQAVTANEIDWAALTSAALEFIACGDCKPYISFSGPAPWEPALLTEGPLRPARIATMTIQLVDDDFSPAADYVAAVRALPGLADTVITTTVYDKENDEYRTTIVLTFDATVLADRYGLAAEAPTTDDATAPTDDAGAVDPTPAPTEEVTP